MTKPDSRLPVLALNSGSSSLKFGLYRVGSSRTETLLSGEAESIGGAAAKIRAQDAHANALLAETTPIATQRDAIARIATLIAGCEMPPPAAVGHRVVHGGPKLRQHCLIDAQVLRELEA